MPDPEGSVCPVIAEPALVFVAIVASEVFPVVWFAAVATPVVFVAIVASEVFPVVWFADVAAPEGSGSEAALTP